MLDNTKHLPASTRQANGLSNPISSPEDESVKMKNFYNQFGE